MDKNLVFPNDLNDDDTFTDMLFLEMLKFSVIWAKNYFFKVISKWRNFPGNADIFGHMVKKLFFKVI